MKKLTILAVVLGLAALLAWLAMRDPAPEGDAPPDAMPTEPAVAADTKPVAPRARARAGDSAEPAATAPAADAAKAPALAKPVESVAESEASGVLTVVGPDESPLAGVRVAFFEWDPEAEPSDGGAADAEPSDLESQVDRILRLGRALETGADGRVLLPKFGRVAAVAARHGGLEACTVLDRTKAPWVLHLRRPARVRARVVDASGKPCPGVDVLLVVTSDDWAYVSDRSTADAAGVAAFADLTDAISEAEADGTTLWLSVAMPLSRRVRAPLDVRALPEQPVELVLPATGSVRCDVADDEGRPAPDGTLVRLAVVPGDGSAADVTVADPDGDEDEAAIEATVSAGTCAFPWIGVGLALEATVSSPDGSRSTATTRGAGPASAGEEVRLRLLFGAARPVVTGRLVSVDGGALAGTKLAGAVLDPQGQTSLFGDEEPATATTDADGRFRLELDTAAGDVPGRKLRIMRPVEGAKWERYKQIAVVELRAIAPGVVTDLGDIRVRGASVLVAGVVVDPRGMPVADAEVRVFDAQPDSWSPVHDVEEVTTAADGSFRIEGSADAGKVFIGVSAPGWILPVPPAVAPGTTDVRLVLAQGGSIAGSIRVPAGLDASSVRVHVVGDAARTGSTTSWYRTPELDDWIGDGGAFEFESVRPGVARVEVRIGWGPDNSVFSVDDVRVVAGETTRDPRLQNIDLAAHLRDYPVTVADEQGRPVPGARAAFRVAGSGGAGFDDVVIGADGVAHVRPKAGPGSAGAVEVVVVCRGYRSVRLPDVRGAATATLRPVKPVTIRVRLADETALPPAPFAIAVGVAFVADADDVNWNDPRSPPDRNDVFGKGRVIAFEVFDSGTYHVSLTLWETSPHGASGSGLTTIPDPVAVTVGEDAGTVEVVVRADPEALARALARREER